MKGHLNINTRQVCCADTGRVLEVPINYMQRQHNEDDSRADDEIIAEYAEKKGWRLSDDGLWYAPRK